MRQVNVQMLVGIARETDEWYVCGWTNKEGSIDEEIVRECVVDYFHDMGLERPHIFKVSTTCVIREDMPVFVNQQE